MNEIDRATAAVTSDRPSAQTAGVQQRCSGPERKGPLRRLRVVDAGNMIAGPLAATLLADLGADVIKIEQPRIGDSMREWAPARDGLSLWWKVIGRNKRLVTLRLSSPEGQALFKQLIRTADIVIENYRPGTFERWGLGYDVLAQINPGLVLVRVSGFGQTGPYACRGGYGTVAEAFSGVPSFTGFPDKPPTFPGFPIGDSVAATFAAMSAMCAIYQRDHDGAGHGQVIDVSLYEPLFRLVESQVIGFDQLGIVKKRQGNRLEEDSPRNAYQTRDGRWIAISASSQKTYERLVHAIGLPDLATDERFKTNAERVANGDVLDRVIADWCLARESADIMRLFEDANVVAGLVFDIKDIFRDPHYAARQNIVEVPDCDFGSVRMQSVVPRFLSSPGEIRHAGGRLGQDNDEVYGQELGLSEHERGRLHELEVI